MKRAALVHERVFAGDFAGEYAQKHGKIAAKFGREIAQKLAQLGLRAERILDVGCGFGTTAIVLAGALPESEVVGIDLSEPLLARAKEAARDAGLERRVSFRKADVGQIPYDDHSFDAVVNVQMLHIVEDPVAMLNEMERVLVPGGMLFMADIRRSWIGYLDKVFKTGLTVQEAGALVARSNLRQGTFSSDLLWWRYEG
ncbi:MAG: class I SAM-dependent methyltransferase [Anaerolineae bacterium]|nr:class I SAM-dependent methyltransferase [Anaerolineae bacterium]